VASPALGKQHSAKKEQQGAYSTEGTQVRSCYSWGTLDSSILDQLHEGVIATDLDANITGGNNAALQMCEYSPAELLGKNLALLYPEEERGLLHSAAIAGVQEKGQHQAELRTRSKSGNDVYVHLSLTVLNNENSIPAGMVAVLLDITRTEVVWADVSGRAGIRFVVLEPALYEEIHHWTERKMKNEGWELPQ